MKRILTYSAIALLLAVALVMAQRPLPSPVVRPAVDQIKIVEIGWRIGGIHARALVGYTRPDGRFVAVDEIQGIWDRREDELRLTDEENQALESIRRKVRAAMATEYVGTTP